MSRVFRVSLREPTWNAGKPERNTTIILKSDVYDNASGRTVEFEEIANVKKIKVGDSININSGGASSKRFFVINGSWESVHDWLIVTKENTATDPVFGANHNTMANGYRTTNQRSDSMFFHDIIPQSAENAKYAIGKWAWTADSKWYYDKQSAKLSSFLDTRGKFSDMTSVTQQGRRLGVVHYKEASIAHSESHNDLNLPEFIALGTFSINKQTYNSDIESWFRISTNDDFMPVSNYFLFVNTSANKQWYVVYDPNEVRYIISPEFDIGPNSLEWSRMAYISQIQGEGDGAWRGSIKQTSMRRDEFYSFAKGNNNMWYFMDSFPDDELQEVKYTPFRQQTIFNNQTWWDIQTQKVKKDMYYNYKSADFLKGTMALGRQVRGQMDL